LTKKNRQRRVVTPPTPFEQARDELFQQIMRCEVIGAAADHQGEWFTETMAYFAARYPELKPADVNDLRQLGERFVQPPKAAAVVEEASTPAPTDAAADDATPGDATPGEATPDEVAIDALVGTDVSVDSITAQSTETVDVEEAETVPA